MRRQVGVLVLGLAANILCDENVGREVAIDRVGVGMRPEMTTMLTDTWRIGAMTSFLLPLFLSLFCRRGELSSAKFEIRV